MPGATQAAEADHTSHMQALRKVERESNAMKIQTARVLQAMVGCNGFDPPCDAPCDAPCG